MGTALVCDFGFTVRQDGPLDRSISAVEGVGDDLSIERQEEEQE